MKIALIGSTGFLGFNLALFLNKQGYQIKLFGRRNHINLNSFCFEELEISSETDFRSLLEFDVIINAIGSAVQSNTIASPNEIFDVNLYFPIRLINYLTNNNFKGKLLTFGSYFEIGDEKDNISYNEIALVFSKNSVPNNYCVSKKLLTNFIQFNNTNIYHLHLFLPHIYGENESNNRLIPYLIQAIKNCEKPALSSGEQIRQYLYIDDLCLGLNEILQKPIQKIVGFLNMPAYETCSVKEIIKTVYNHFDVKLDESQFGKLTARDTSMKYLELNCEKYYQYNLPKPQFSIKNNIIKYKDV
jgi:nucleoside-diphosphate-sugar epimerase